ncbi:MAG: helix-turn-helix domain-containing protein [Alphaproteobacteria bacterium]|nr:helix-turn-helix domain-containing protein [Alphaproteobacteria bacterium]
MSIVEIPKLIGEDAAYARYPDVLQDKELRNARQEGKIGYYKRKGRILYREDELAEYVKAALERSYEPPCQTDSEKPSSGSAPIGEATSTAPETSTASGMTPDQERSAASLLRQQAAKRPNSEPPRSGLQKPSLKLVNQKT